MVKSTDLFQLIKSLTKSEKRYFKLSASVHTGDKKYLKLFDAMDSQEVYDEDAIKTLYREERFTKRLTFTKNYLYNLILRTQTDIGSSQTLENHLRHMLNEAEWLISKALYTQSEKILEKARILAHRYEKFPCLLEICSIQLKIFTRESNSNSIKKYLSEGFEKELQFIDQLKNIIEYRMLYMKNDIIMREWGVIRASSESEIYSDIICHPLMQDEISAHSNTASLYFLTLHLAYSYAMRDWQKVYTYSKQGIAIFGYSDPMASNLPSYISILGVFGDACSVLKKYAEVQGTTKKMRDLAEYPGFRDSEDMRTRIFRFSYLLEIRLYIRTGEFNAGIRVADEIQNGLEKFKNKLGLETLMSFYYELALLYFGANNLSLSQYWLNKIINIPKYTARPDLHSLARILFLLVQFELGNQDILDYIVKSTYRFLAKRERLYKTENIILDFIRLRLPKITNQQELIPVFTDIKKKLLEIFENPYECRILEYFDFISWLESKIHNRPFAEIIREKAGYDQINIGRP